MFFFDSFLVGAWSLWVSVSYTFLSFLFLYQSQNVIVHEVFYDPNFPIFSPPVFLFLSWRLFSLVKVCIGKKLLPFAKAIFTILAARALPFFSLSTLICPLESVPGLSLLPPAGFSLLFPLVSVPKL